VSEAHRVTATGLDVRYDRYNLEYAVSDGWPFYLTPCCDASAKAVETGIVCRFCYAAVNQDLGGVPEPLPEDDLAGWRDTREQFGDVVAFRMTLPKRSEE